MALKMEIPEWLLFHVPFHFVTCPEHCAPTVAAAGPNTEVDTVKLRAVYFSVTP